jgi:hypothetical protein
MSIPSVLPFVGAALVPAVGKVIEGISESLSFLDVMQQQESSNQIESASATEPSTLNSDLATLVERLRERFAKLGIDLSTSVQLKPDGRDGVTVDGDHPDRVLIESIFGSDEELTGLFNSVANSATQEQESKTSAITRQFRLALTPNAASIEFA